MALWPKSRIWNVNSGWLESIQYVFISIFFLKDVVLNSLPDLTMLSLKISVGIFTLTFCRYVFYRWNHRRQSSIEKTLINNLLFVRESVSNKLTDGLTNRQIMEKKLPIMIFVDKFNISSTWKLYVISSVFYSFISISIGKSPYVIPLVF
jgi:hypothetical protein